jgi:hypothetical protein
MQHGEIGTVGGKDKPEDPEATPTLPSLVFPVWYSVLHRRFRLVSSITAFIAPESPFLLLHFSPPLLLSFPFLFFSWEAIAISFGLPNQTTLTARPPQRPSPDQTRTLTYS